MGVGNIQLYNNVKITMALNQEVLISSLFRSKKKEASTTTNNEQRVRSNFPQKKTTIIQCGGGVTIRTDGILCGYYNLR